MEYRNFATDHYLLSVGFSLLPCIFIDISSVMGSKTLQLCFSIYVLAEENLYLSTEDVSMYLLRKLLHK